MQLDEFLFRNKMPQMELASRLNIHKAYLSHIVCGRVKPSLELALSIQYETEGLVTWVEVFEKWIALHPPKKRKKRTATRPPRVSQKENP